MRLCEEDSSASPRENESENACSANYEEKENEMTKHNLNRSSPISVVELNCNMVEVTNATTSLSTCTKEHAKDGDGVEVSNDDTGTCNQIGYRLEKRHSYVSIMPTINEVDTKEEDEEDNGVADNMDNLLTIVIEDDDISLHIRPLAASSPRHDIIKNKQEVKRLSDSASVCASRGNERKAILLYKESLKILKQGVKRISIEMETASSKPKLEKTALYIVLHEEWTEFALAIADIRTLMAIIYERLGEYDKAICCCEEARTVYQRQGVFDERHQRKSSDAQAQQETMEKKVKKLEEGRGSYNARKSVHETINRIQEKIRTTNDATSIEFLYEDIFDKLSAVLSLEVDNLGETHPQVAETKSILGMLYSERGEHEQAFQEIDDAVSINETVLGCLHPKTGMKYQQAAKIYERRHGEAYKKKSLEFYEKAVTTFEEAEGDFSETLCSLLNDAGVLYIQTKEYDMAIKKFTEAIKICYKMNEGKDCLTIYSIQIWLNLAKCYSAHKEQELATNATRRALEIQREARKAYDAQNRTGESMHLLLTNYGIVTSLKRMGRNLTAQNKFEQACGSYHEALSMLQTDYSLAQELATSNPNVDLGKHQDEIAAILYCLAEAKQADEKYTEAIHLFEESLQLRSDSDRIRDNKMNHVHCAMSLAGIGSVYLKRDQSSEAFKYFNKAIHCIRKEGLPEFHPIVKMLWDRSHVAANKMLLENSIAKNLKTEAHQKSCSISLEKHNDAHINPWRFTVSRLEEKAVDEREYGDIEGSIRTLKLVVGMRRTYLSKSRQAGKNDTKIKLELASSLIKLGRMEVLTNRVKRGMICFKEALDLCKSSGLKDGDEFVQEIESILQELRQQLRNTQSKIEETKAEF